MVKVFLYAGRTKIVSYGSPKKKGQVSRIQVVWGAGQVIRNVTRVSVFSLIEIEYP